jgi:hypothetical protein
VESFGTTASKVCKCAQHFHFTVATRCHDSGSHRRPYPRYGGCGDPRSQPSCVLVEYVQTPMPLLNTCISVVSLKTQRWLCRVGASHLDCTRIRRRESAHRPASSSRALSSEASQKKSGINSIISLCDRLHLVNFRTAFVNLPFFRFNCGVPVCRGELARKRSTYHHQRQPRFGSWAVTVISAGWVHCTLYSPRKSRPSLSWFWALHLRGERGAFVVLTLQWFTTLADRVDRGVEVAEVTSL